MQSEILLGRILQILIERGKSKYQTYNDFVYDSYDGKAIYVIRENGERAKLYFRKILVAIEAYQQDATAYDEGPSRLRDFGLTHITSPIHSLLHLLKKEDYLE